MIVVDNQMCVEMSGIGKISEERGALDEQVLAIVERHADVHKSAHNTPAVLHGQVDLGREVARLHCLRAGDNPTENPS